MRILPIFCLFALIFSAGVLNAQSRFLVQSGRTETITESVLMTDEFILEENAKLVFASSVRTWSLTAKKAIFKQGATIDGRGASTAGQGATGVGGSGSSDCRPGKNGGTGGEGAPGGSGVNINMDVGIESLGDLTILTGGGTGQTGGTGGVGGQGGQASLQGDCRGGLGGTGGQGGLGGQGGQGGSVVFEWKKIREEEALDERDVGKGIRISSQGGQGGVGGKPGGGGLGGAQVEHCTPKPFRVCLKKGGGGAGAPGTRGLQGPNGSSPFPIIRRMQH